jgi:hypothetical protein
MLKWFNSLSYGSCQFSIHNFKIVSHLSKSQCLTHENEEEKEEEDKEEKKKKLMMMMMMMMMKK